MIEKDFSGTIRASHFDTSQEALEQMLRADLEKLQMAGLTPTVGDARCLLFGHIIHLAVWQLRSTWLSDVPVKDKLEQVRTALQRIYPLDLLRRLATQILSSLSEATQGKVFTLKTLDRLVESTALKAFKSG